jgi:hypothetical protein
LHACDCEAPFEAAQAVPPLAAGVLTEYDCVCVPLPHVTEHAPHDPHDPTQLVAAGHAPLLHACDCEAPFEAAQAVPPLAAGVLTEYDRVCVPLPHVTEHAPHDPHDPTQLVAAAATVIEREARLYQVE